MESIVSLAHHTQGHKTTNQCAKLTSVLPIKLSHIMDNATHAQMAHTLMLPGGIVCSQCNFSKSTIQMSLVDQDKSTTQMDTAASIAQHTPELKTITHSVLQIHVTPLRSSVTKVTVSFSAHLELSKINMVGDVSAFQCQLSYLT
jgi:hypothetical protein